MTLYAVIFYILAAVIITATGLAITRRNLVHAVVYLVISFFGTAMLFYLLGAPLLAALEVIIYAGAIMVLFLFIIMMLKVDTRNERLLPPGQFVPAAILSLIYLIVGAMLVFTDPGSRTALEPAVARPADFGQYVFEKHWLSVEIVSLLLLVVTVGVLLLGRENKKRRSQTEEKS